MPHTVATLAEHVGGRVVGDGSTPISGAKPLATAGPGDLAFVENEQHQADLKLCRAAAVLAPPGLLDVALPVIEAADPLRAFTLVYQLFHPQPKAYPPGIDPRAAIAPDAELGRDVVIHPFASVGSGTKVGERSQLYPGVTVGRNCTIGPDCILYPGAVVYDGCTLGARCILHAHAVVGADGFGYRLHQGRHVKVPQLAGVVLGDDVELGAGTTVDRGTFEPTTIGTGTKMDNQVQIGHNCRIGKHNLLVSQVGIGGSSTTGDYVVIAGQVGVADHVNIGDRVMIGAKAGVHQDIETGQKMLGAPARPERDAKVILLSLDKLPELRQDVRKIKKHLGLAG